MNLASAIFSNLKLFYNTINPATLSGAIDIVVVVQPDQTLKSTPFHVRFSKWAIFNIDQNEYIDIQVNNDRVEGVKMRLGSDEAAHIVDTDQLKNLRLVRGENEVTFSYTSRLQGTARCTSHIWLLSWVERIVISDIDGTITRSDVLGHVIPAIGGTWAHAGVAELYTRIKNNGYRIIYLSSRAIGQSHSTKAYLQNMAQNSIRLPSGPVMLAPMSVLTAFQKEVIERRPYEFKIACLTELRALFPVDQPFFAGFGNRDTDVRSYLAVGIPLSRIFLVDPSGRLQCAGQHGFETNYTLLAKQHTADIFFPPLNNTEREQCKTIEQLDAASPLPNALTSSSFTYWRNRSDDSAEIDDQELARYEANRVQDRQSAKPPSKPSYYSRLFDKH